MQHRRATGPLQELETNIVVSGLRSPTGASAQLIGSALSGLCRPLLSVPLALEYEAVCCDPQQRAASGLTRTEVLKIIDALCAVAEHVTVDFRWRPLLRDPADEMVIEAAINGRADALVTFNQRHFKPGAAKFNVDLLTPKGSIGEDAAMKSQTANSHCDCRCL